MPLAGVLADVKALKQRAWQRVAQEEGLWLPSSSGDPMYDNIHDMRLERAITEASK